MTFTGRELTPEEEEKMLNRLVDEISKRGLEVPAVLFLETLKPLSFVGTQFGLAYLGPFLEGTFGSVGNEYINLFTKRENVNKVIEKIEKLLKEDEKRKKEEDKKTKEKKLFGIFPKRLV